jgi:predicted nucleic acid-binding Zn finger protein
MTSWTRHEGTITESLRHSVLEKWGDRGRKALLAVEEWRVKRYRDFFVVVGRSDEYVVDDEFCTCSDFLYRGRECWHILAVRIARMTGRFEEYPMWYQDTWIKKE